MASARYLNNQQANQQRPCRAPGCCNSRTGVSLWCRAHKLKADHYGHPDAKPLKPSLWAPQRKAVGKLVDRNEDHAGIQSALSFLTEWKMRGATDQRAYKGADEVARLSRHGVTSRAILVEVCACKMWLDQNRGVLPDETCEAVALSRAVFALAPRERRRTRRADGYWPVSKTLAQQHSYSPKPRRSATRHVGVFLLKSMAGLLANITLTLEAEALREQAQRAALQAPLMGAQQ